MHLNSAAAAVTHLKTNGTDIFHTLDTQAANKGGTAKGWEFSFDDPQPDPLPSPAASASHGSPASMPSFFSPKSTLPTCAYYGDKLHRDITTCSNCTCKVRALCTQGGHCFKCVCRVCHDPLKGGMRSCETCMHRVYTTCALHVAFRVEVVCKTCTPRRKVVSRRLQEV